MALLAYHSPTERLDSEYKGRIKELDELINLPEAIKERFTKKPKSEVV